MIIKRCKICQGKYQEIAKTNLLKNKEDKLGKKENSEKINKFYQKGMNK